MAAKIQIPKAERGEDYDIDCFSRSERETIIQAFEESKEYSYYASLNVGIPGCSSSFGSCRSTAIDRVSG
jgi:hypothetical protein